MLLAVPHVCFGLSPPARDGRGDCKGWHMEDQDEVVAVIAVSVVRRWLGVGILVSIGVMALYVAFAAAPDFAGQAFLVSVGLLSLWVADKMRRATELWIELTPSELRDSSGKLIAKVEDIQKLESGFLAFKPSNGFLISTASSQSWVWLPGVWWRFGRRIGIGGVTPASQTKGMAQIIAMMVATQDQDQDSHTT